MSGVELEGSFDLGFLGRLQGELLDQLAEETRDHAKAPMGGPGPNPPSDPGNAPNRQTSDLYEHVVAVRTSSDSSETQSTRPSGAEEVPEWLEYGTPGGRMAARPYMRPAYEKTLADFNRIVEESARRAAR